MTSMPLVRAAVLAMVLVALPAVASAQRGGRGMGGSKEADWNAVTAGVPKGPSISGKDLTEASPLQALLDKKKQLKLTDTQIAAIKEADGKLQTMNQERYLLVDSLKKQMRPSVAPTAEDEARLVVARESMQGVVRDIRTSHDVEAKAIVTTLDADQQKIAAEVLDKHAEKVQKMLRDKLGGGPGGGGGRRGPGAL